MRFSNQLDQVISTLVATLNKKCFFVYSYFSKLLCLLLFGFVIGSLFGSITNAFQNDSFLGGCIGIVTLFFIEIISYLTYHYKTRSFFIFIGYPKDFHAASWRFANTFKIGLMLGFFVDAFKVGS